MTPITIQNKKYSIKCIEELTTKEFIELSKIENCDLVKYIAHQTGQDLSIAFFAVTDETLEEAIGKAPDITKLPLNAVPYIDLTKGIDTVGQRLQVESSNLTGYELLVFCLAVAQARSNNIDEVYSKRDWYLNKPFYETLPAGFFFFGNYKHGKNKGEKFFVWLLELIRMWQLRSKLELVA